MNWFTCLLLFDMNLNCKHIVIATSIEPLRNHAQSSMRLLKPCSSIRSLLLALSRRGWLPNQRNRHVRPSELTGQPSGDSSLLELCVVDLIAQHNKAANE